jgi:hypothetical protein
MAGFDLMGITKLRNNITWSLMKAAIKEKIMDKLNGYKAYISVGIGVIATGLFGAGYIDDKTFAVIENICLMLGIGFTRAGVKKVGK